MRSLAFGMSLLLVFSSSFENMILLEGIGAISRLVGIIASAFWLLAIIWTGEFRRLRAFHIAAGLFVLWCASSIMWTVDVVQTRQRIQTWLQLLVLVVMIWDLYRSPRDVESAMQAYILGALVAVGSAGFNYSQSVEVDPLRYAAAGFNPNDFALILALGMPMAWYLAVLGHYCRRSRMLTFLNLAYLPLAFGGILLAASRGSLVAASPIVALVLVSFGRVANWQRVAILTSVVFFAVLVPIVTPPRSLERLATVDESIAAGDLGGRVAIWREGLRIFRTHPFAGVGSGAFRAASESGKVAHNVFLSVLAEVGLVGLTLFMAALAFTVINALSHRRWLLLTWVTVLSIWGLGAMVHTWEHYKQTWIILSLVAASAAAMGRVDTVRRPASVT